MKKYIKLSGLAAICSVFVTSMAVLGVADASAEQKTLVDYLNDKNVSFLIVNTGATARLTTFGWKDATESCKFIRTAGFNVSNIRNFAEDALAETNAVCKN